MTDLFDGATRHDAGGKSRFRLHRGVSGSAMFSPCERYRYCLRRNWTDRADEPFALWIGMNPSTAAAEIDDPTIRREMRFTGTMGFDAYVKVNVMDYRATDPKRLLAPGVLPCSDGNAAFIGELAKQAGCVIAAWGALPRPLRGYVDLVLTTLADRQLWCLGKTADGSPRHPLYVRSDAELVPWP